MRLSPAAQQAPTPSGRLRQRHARLHATGTDNPFHPVHLQPELYVTAQVAGQVRAVGLHLATVTDNTYTSAVYMGRVIAQMAGQVRAVGLHLATVTANMWFMRVVYNPVATVAVAVVVDVQGHVYARVVTLDRQCRHVTLKQNALGLNPARLPTVRLPRAMEVNTTA